jgi:DNA-binding IscR family transcriptional regulator
LAHPPSEISIGKILKVLENTIFSIECKRKVGNYSQVRKKKCLIKGAWRKIQNILDSNLDSIALADLIKN